jgi:hypothetical protein
MAYRVVIPGTGLVLGVFADQQDAYQCYLKHYTTACSLQPTIEQI